MMRRGQFWHCYIAIMIICFFSLLCWVNVFKKLDAYCVGNEGVKLVEFWEDCTVKRKEISYVGQKLTWILYHEIASDEVILGKEDWLFYRSLDAGDTIADYEGANHYNEAELMIKQKNLSASQEKLAACGIQMGVIVRPIRKTYIMSICLNCSKEVTLQEQTLWLSTYRSQV